jgi:glucitol operon activator protein
MWGWLIGLFTFTWVLQLVLTRVQMKNYQKTLKEMSTRSSGFLGVGIHKQRIGVGSIVILVTDENGKVIDGQKMAGVTVFSRFAPFHTFNGLLVQEVKEMIHEHPLRVAIESSLEQINKQRKKTLVG